MIEIILLFISGCAVWQGRWDIASFFLIWVVIIKQDAHTRMWKECLQGVRDILKMKTEMMEDNQEIPKKK